MFCRWRVSCEMGVSGGLIENSKLLALISKLSAKFRMIPIEIIAAEIVEDLQAALAQFAEIAQDLKSNCM
jgi:hypothetical protein